MSTSRVAFSDLRMAAYCPRKLYYARRGDREPPPSVERVRALADRYESLLSADDEALEAAPIDPDPAAYREALSASRTRRDRWPDLLDPAERDAFVAGRDCHGVVHKVLEAPVEPALISAGKPPERGIWEPQSVHAVAAAKALSWEYETGVDHAVVEYPAHGVIRRIDLTTRRKATYRRVLRTVRSIDGPPPRVRDRSKCECCEYADECGVRTRTLRSLLGFGD